MSRAFLQAFLPMMLVVSGLVSGCAGQQPKTLGSLDYEPEPEPEPSSEVDNASHEEVRTEYEGLVNMVEDEQLKRSIQQRIGDVYMLEGEREQLEPEPGKSYYLEAIKSYRDILEEYPNSPNNAEILYQLAKAYDMEGDQQEALNVLRELTSRHPAYENIAEANFRKADILFNLGAYDEAENAYQAVTEHPESSFHLNAHYMLAWSRYKQLRFRDALDEYVFVLNQLLRPGVTLGNLSDPNQSLVEDTLHAVTLTLDKLAGAAVIQSLPQLKDRHYVWRVYDHLGEYYLDKELYEASAQSYRQFVEHYPHDNRTPILHRKVIQTYVEGSFPKQAFDEKEQFVEAYGIYSKYADSRGGVPGSIEDTVKDYLHELARNYHARGQELQTELEEMNENEQGRPRPEKVNELESGAVAALDKAAYFYKQFMETFPNDEQRDELAFFRAEALFAAGRYEQSIPGYEGVAYQPQTDSAEKYGADAGYAAILAYERHLEGLEDDSLDHEQWRADAVESMLRFTNSYHQDERATSVLSKASEHMFDLEQYQRALGAARSMLDNNTELDTGLKKTAYGITARALFNLERFDQAAEDYLAQRGLVDENGDEYQRITERLASSIYKHAEVLMAADKNATAVEELLRLKELTPQSPVRVTGQYDAATLLLDMQEWPHAIAELNELAQRYPEHELAKEFPRKLAFAYEKSEDWQRAADTYKHLSESDPDPELRQEALYLAGTMYENSEDYSQAIQQLRDYANNHPEPLATNMEARFKLAENYARIGDGEKRRFWLQKLVEGHREAGEERNDRTRWLAAWANMEYGDHFAQEFSRHNVYPPLGESLPAKNEQLEKAAERYEMAADSGILDFVTMSTYKIAELYRSLARELRDSPRPAGLSEEEKNLYDEILVEQSLPFEELAMEVHQSNIERAWDGEFDPWIQQSYARMRELHPRRFAKAEVIVSYGDEIR